jgi:hypothetical protein
MCIQRAILYIVKYLYRTSQTPTIIDHFRHLLCRTYSDHIMDSSLYHVLLRRAHTLAEEHRVFDEDISTIVKQVSTTCRTRNVPEDKDKLSNTMTFVLGRLDELSRLRQVYSALHTELTQFVESCRRTWYDETLVWVRDNTILMPRITLLKLSDLIEVENVHRDLLAHRSDLNKQQVQIESTITGINLLKSLCDLNMIRTLFDGDPQRSKELHTMMTAICTHIPTHTEYNAVYGSLCMYVQNSHNDLIADLLSHITKH